MAQKKIVQFYRMPGGAIAAGIDVTRKDIRNGFNSAEAGIHLVRGFWYTKKAFKSLSADEQKERKELCGLFKSPAYGNGVGDLQCYGKVFGSLRVWGAAARPLRKVSASSPARLLRRL